MGSGPGGPLWSRGQSLLNLLDGGGFTDSPRPHKQETRGLDTIQATSSSPWWLLFFQENCQAKGDL